MTIRNAGRVTLALAAAVFALTSAAGASPTAPPESESQLADIVRQHPGLIDYIRQHPNLDLGKLGETVRPNDLTPGMNGISHSRTAELITCRPGVRNVGYNVRETGLKIEYHEPSSGAPADLRAGECAWHDGKPRSKNSDRSGWLCVPEPGAVMLYLDGGFTVHSMQARMARYLYDLQQENGKNIVFRVRPTPTCLNILEEVNA